MESLGEKLKSARESKKYTLDQVGRDTNIAGRYLEALEREDFSVFPGEAYALGFLRNYGEYLGFQGEDLISLYRALKIQEQPIPVEELLKSPSRVPKILLMTFIILLVLGLAGGGIYFFIRYFPPKAAADVTPREAAVYTLDEPSMERRFYRGDAVLVPLGTTRYRLELSGLGELLTITTPGGTVNFDMSQTVDLDLNGDGIGDIRVTAADYAKNDAAAGALIRIEQNNDTRLTEEAPPAVSGDPVPEIPAPVSPSAVIFSSPTPYPFTLQANFQGYCMFRWEILAERDRQGRNERYFQRTDELNIQAQNGIRIWVSNAAAVKLQVTGGGRTMPMEIGGAGEVVVADLRWIRDDDGRYRLVVARLE
ncbi:helix-turn-helix domain-containing protein [Treponema sp. TIM-1]|uniref:helix-turn-helix domain-containing protein n=1 Tax=Treponema sp. TIM-1 TaxID=2898417 RepID=UPI00397E975D